MPLSRSSTLRTKSRSPAPPTTATMQGNLNSFSSRAAVTQRPFLPPSHYAAAGGYLSPEHTLSEQRCVSGDVELGGVHQSERGQVIAPMRAPKSHRNDIDSDFRNDFQTLSPRDGTRPSVHHAGPNDTVLDGYTGTSKVAKRPRDLQERSPGASNVESRALPSLRDTIDRMTGSPQILVDTAIKSPHMQRKSSRGFAASSRGTLDERFSSPLLTPQMNAVNTKGAAENVRYMMDNQFSLIPDANSQTLDKAQHQQALRTPIGSQVHPSRGELEAFTPTSPVLRLPAKPALKHHGVSLSNTHNAAHTRTDIFPEQNHHTESTMSMNPLRTVKSLLSRKNSNTTKSPSLPKTPQMVSTKNGTPATSKEPSRNNSVHTLKPKKRIQQPTDVHFLHVHNRDSSLDQDAGQRSSSRSSTSSKSPYSFKSHIPRRTRHVNPHKRGDSSEASLFVDDSDLEARCELERTSMRKLMVTNGRPPDTSESGSILDSVSLSTASSAPDSDLRTDVAFSREYVVEEDREPNESTSLDEEILRHLDASYVPVTHRNDVGIGLGVSVSPLIHPGGSPNKQHQLQDRISYARKTLARGGRPNPTQQAQHPPGMYSATPPALLSSRSAASPRNATSGPPEKTLRFSLPPSDSGLSTYSDEEATTSEVVHGVVPGSMVSRQDRWSRVGSDWNDGSYQLPKDGNTNPTGFQKLPAKCDSTLISKVSNSTNPASRSPSPVYHTRYTKYDSGDSEHELGRKDTRRKSQRERTNRSRSASVGPLSSRHSLATEDREVASRHLHAKSATHSRLESQPPRPMSACQLSRQKNRSKERDGGYQRPVSQVFPPHLRDLIKDRRSATHDFTKGDHPQDQAPAYDEGYDSVSASEFVASPRSSGYSSIYADKRRESLPSAHHTPISTPRPRFHPPQPDISGKDLRSIAARERLAFGIPPSESDEVIYPPSEPQHQVSGDEQESSSGGLSHAESDMSSLNQSLWQAEEEQRYEEDGNKLLQSISRRVEGGRGKDKFRKSDMSENTTTPRLSIISPTESGSSSCEGLYESIRPTLGSSPLPPENRFQSPAPQATSEFPPNPKPDLQTLLSTKETFQTREAVIQELFESEETLLHFLHICVDNFILPLRVQNSRAWISGVPSSISRLLDWFDDIVHLHEGVHEGLCAARDMQTAESERVSEVLRECFVLRVEVYMPYFMRINDVVDEISALVGRQSVPEEGLVTNNAGVGARKSEFGQFILLQERLPECQGWTLDDFLRLPLRRLEAYQNLFEKMLQLTPKNHQDYLSTLSLSRSTDVAMQVMTEVKFREDEYRLLRSFSKRIQAPSSLEHLSTRERRLLFSGPCLLLQPGYLLNSGDASSATTYDQPVGNSELVSGAGVQRSDSLRSASSSQPHESRRNPSKNSWFSLLPRRKRNKTKSSAASAEGPVTASDSLFDPEEFASLQGMPLYAFVFNDLILLAHAHDDNSENAPWNLLQHSGIIKPLSISHRQHPKVHVGSLVTLEGIALDPQNINDPADNFSRYSHRELDLVFTPPAPRSTNHGNSFADALRTALTTCRSTVLKWLSIPQSTIAPGGTTSTSRLITDYALDTQEIVSSLVASGLPPPRSPSGLIAGDKACGAAMESNDGDEREERGWWSLCYQRSLRELQRKDW